MGRKLNIMACKDCERKKKNRKAKVSVEPIEKPKVYRTNKNGDEITWNNNV